MTHESRRNETHAHDWLPDAGLIEPVLLDGIEPDLADDPIDSLAPDIELPVAYVGDEHTHGGYA